MYGQIYSVHVINLYIFLRTQNEAMHTLLCTLLCTQNKKKHSLMDQTIFDTPYISGVYLTNVTTLGNKYIFREGTFKCDFCSLSFIESFKELARLGMNLLDSPIEQNSLTKLISLG